MADLFADQVLGLLFGTVLLVLAVAGYVALEWHASNEYRAARRSKLR